MVLRPEPSDATPQHPPHPASSGPRRDRRRPRRRQPPLEVTLTGAPYENGRTRTGPEAQRGLDRQHHPRRPERRPDAHWLFQREGRRAAGGGARRGPHGETWRQGHHSRRAPDDLVSLTLTLTQEHPHMARYLISTTGAAYTSTYVADTQ